MLGPMKIALLALVVGALVALPSAWAQDTPAAPSLEAPRAPARPALPKIDYVVRDQDFHVLPRPQRASPGRTEVLVFFWYGSPAAAKIDPYLRDWVASGRAPANLRLQYVPLSLDQTWTFGARVFYALEQMGLEHEMTPRLLRAVQAKAVDLASPVSVNAWLRDQGVDLAKFQRAINSDAVVARTASLPAIARAYHVRSSPTFVLEGRYHVAATPKMPIERAAAVAMFMAQKLSEGGERP